MLTMCRPTLTSSIKLGEEPAVVVVDAGVAVDVVAVVDVAVVVVAVVVVVVVVAGEIKTDAVNRSRPTRLEVVMIQ